MQVVDAIQQEFAQKLYSRYGLPAYRCDREVGTVGRNGCGNPRKIVAVDDVTTVHQTAANPKRATRKGRSVLHPCRICFEVFDQERRITTLS